MKRYVLKRGPLAIQADGTPAGYRELMHLRRTIVELAGGRITDILQLRPSDLPTGIYYNPMTGEILPVVRITQKGKRYTIADIRAANKAAGHHFFDHDTMRFHNDRVSCWKVIHRDSPDPARPGHFPRRIFIHNRATQRVREFFPADGSIGTPITNQEREALNI